MPFPQKVLPRCYAPDDRCKTVDNTTYIVMCVDIMYCPMNFFLALDMLTDPPIILVDKFHF